MFTSVKLQHVEANLPPHSVYELGIGIYEQPDRFCLAARVFGKSRGQIDVDVARTFRKENETNVRRAAFESCVDRLGRGKAADLDADSGHGSGV